MHDVGMYCAKGMEKTSVNVAVCDGGNRSPQFGEGDKSRTAVVRAELPGNHYGHKRRRRSLMTGMHFLKKAAGWPVIVLCIFSITSASALFGYQPAGSMGASAEITDGDRVSKILTILEFRSANRKVLEKAAGKMYAMSDKELRLISSLCDRISVKKDTAGADIAFSVITAMIVLS
jgi:hypothetical protein